jgi:hypothetical protein
MRIVRLISSSLAIAGAMMVSSAAQAQNQNLFTAPFGPGGTWNLYEVFGGNSIYAPNPPTTWWSANTIASDSSRTISGVTKNGYLASLHSLAENAYVHSIAGGGDVWIGLTDNETFGGTEHGNTSGLPRPPAGQVPGPGQYGVGWVWTSGEPMTFINWGGGEPNDFNGAEDAGHLRGDGQWNDHGLGALGQSGPDLRYVVEYPFNFADPVPGANFVYPQSGPPTMPPAPLPGPEGGAGFFGLVEVRGLGGVPHIRDAIAKVTSGGGTRFEGTAPYINHTDPQTNPTAGMFNPKIPFLSDTAGDDNDIQALYKGRIRVPETGVYTVGVQSDDGFVLRIVGKNFSNVYGAGMIDSSDPANNVLAHPAPTGNSNTRGVITLEKGDYDIEYVVYENGGGAWWEVFVAPGHHQNFGDTGAWRLIGDADTGPPVAAPRNIVLTGPATVTNMNMATGPGSLAGIRLLTRSINDKVKAGTPLSAGEFAAQRAEINLYDPQAGRCCGVPIVDPAFPFANDTGGNDDNFITGIFGTFDVLESGVYTFFLYTDDGVQLRIKGKSFENAVSLTGDGPGTLQNVDGDLALTGDYWTGNSNLSGKITLEAGQYEFEAFQYEGGGDAHFQIWFASGDRVAAFNRNDFYLLSTSTNVNPSRWSGFALVESSNPADVNKDGVVNRWDVVALARQYGDAGEGLDADVNRDGVVDLSDVRLLQAALETGVLSPVAAVPEPSSLLLCVLGGIGLALGARRRRIKAQA